MTDIERDCGVIVRCDLKKSVLCDEGRIGEPRLHQAMGDAAPLEAGMHGEGEQLRLACDSSGECKAALCGEGAAVGLAQKLGKLPGGPSARVYECGRLDIRHLRRCHGMIRGVYRARAPHRAV